MVDQFDKIIQIYSWAIAAFLMFFIIAIAIFYEKKFEKRTYYYYYLIPTFLFFASAIHFFYYNTFMSEIVELIGSVGSFLAGYFLYSLMVGVRK